MVFEHHPQRPYEAPRQKKNVVQYVFWVIIVIVSMKSKVLGARKQVRNRHHPVQKHIKP